MFGIHHKQYLVFWLKYVEWNATCNCLNVDHSKWKGYVDWLISNHETIPVKFWHKVLKWWKAYLAEGLLNISTLPKLYNTQCIWTHGPLQMAITYWSQVLWTRSFWYGSLVLRPSLKRSGPQLIDPLDLYL